MTNTRASLARAQALLRQTLNGYERALPQFPAILGLGDGTVQVVDKPGYVWVRFGAIGNEGVSMVWNQEVQYRDGLAITVGYRTEQPTLLQVLCQREVYAGQADGFIPQVVPHHQTHQWEDPNGGDDVVYVQVRQWMALRVGVAGEFSVSVKPAIVGRQGVWVALETQIIDLEEYVPVGLYARYVLVALDETGAVCAIPGALVTPPSAVTISDCPWPTSTDMIPLAAVRMYQGQPEISDVPGNRDIFDLRWPQLGGAGAIPLLDAIAAVDSAMEQMNTYLVRRADTVQNQAQAGGLDHDVYLTQDRLVQQGQALRMVLAAGDPDAEFTIVWLFQRLDALERAMVAMDSALDMAISGHVTVNA
jgi:hypothetical protein